MPLSDQCFTVAMNETVLSGYLGWVKNPATKQFMMVGHADGPKLLPSEIVQPERVVNWIQEAASEQSQLVKKAKDCVVVPQSSGAVQPFHVRGGGGTAPMNKSTTRNDLQTC